MPHGIEIELNSRQTAAVFGGEPNGHWKSTEAALVPLIRMSSNRGRLGRLYRDGGIMADSRDS